MNTPQNTDPATQSAPRSTTHSPESKHGRRKRPGYPRLSSVLARALDPVIGRWTRGSGCIAVFHRVVDDVGGTRIANLDVEIPPQMLADTVQLLGARGFDVVDLDEAVRRLRRGGGKRRFAVLTFDDGYREHATVVPEMARELGVPITVYVCSDFVHRRSTFWWYLLEDALLRDDRLRWPEKNGERVWLARTREEKVSTYAEVGALLGALAGDDLARAQEALFGADVVQRTAERIALGVGDLKAMAALEGVTVGCHTASHPVLSGLPVAVVRDELGRGRDEIEAVTRSPVRHLAYPYGSRLQVGRREVEIATHLEFATATTTRLGHVLPRHSDHLCALPRVYVPGPDILSMGRALSGVTPWLRHRGRRFVAL